MPNEKFRVYDAEIVQWLSPDWENFVSPNGNELVSPLQLFPYRYINNDPINGKHLYLQGAMGKYLAKQQFTDNFFYFEFKE